MRPLEKVVPCACTTPTTGMSGLGETSREPASHLALATHPAGQYLASSGTFRVLIAAQQIETATWWRRQRNTREMSSSCENLRSPHTLLVSTVLWTLFRLYSRYQSKRGATGEKCKRLNARTVMGQGRNRAGHRGITIGNRWEEHCEREREGRHVLVQGMDDMETGREVERRELRSGKGTERATGKVRLRAGPPVAHERAERRSSGTVSRREGTRMREERKREEGRVSEQVSNEWRFAPPRHHPSLIRTHAAEPGGGGSSSTWPCRTRRRQSTRT